MRPSILFICASFGGGIGKMIRFVTGLCVEEFENVYLLHRGKESENDVTPQGVKEVVLSGNHKYLMPIWRYRQIINIRREINSIKPDVICCFGTEMAVMLSIAMLGIKDSSRVILAERGDPYTLPRIWQILTRWAFHRSHNCIFQLEKQGIWYGPKIMSKSIIIPNAFIPTGNLPNYNNERKKTIVSVGRFVYEKRYEVLINAFAKVHEKHPAYKLILYGEGPYRSIYEDMIERLNISESVEMPGYTNNSMAAIQGSGVFVLPSLYEGMPNALIEALSVGVPCVATDCTPGGPDFLTMHGTAGLLVPVNDEDAMAEAICKIIESSSLALELGYRGKEVIKLLDPVKISEMWLSFLKN